MAGVSLGLANATNARDLGGYPSRDGLTVRRGLLYRANALNRLTDADLELVGRLELACVIDFRHPHEIDLIGPDRLPPMRPTRLVSLPLFDPAHDVFTTVSEVLTGLPGATAKLRDGWTAAAMLELYRWLVDAPMSREIFADAIRLIAERENLPLMFHCTAGKDRTGWLSALVLSALGVDRELVIKDYLRTNDLTAAGRTHVLARATGRFGDPTQLLPLLEARREYLDEGFAEMDRVYGGMDDYLRVGLGLDERTLEALRANLLC